MNISINQKKLLGGQESSKVQWLRDEILKKNTQISAANREYKQMLETRTEAVISGQAPRSAHADTAHINRLESEISDIKSMLSEYGLNNRTSGLDQLKRGASNVMSDDNEENYYDGNNQKNFIKEQKQAIKDQQEKVERAKSQYKLDKASVEELRLADPALYRKKSEILAKVKEDLDRRIARLNERTSKIKEMEAKM